VQAPLLPLTPKRSEAFGRFFSSLVSLDEVIRYLKECDEAVDAETDNAEELLSRANRKRASQGLPLFTLLPGIPTQTKRRDKPERTKKVASPRPPPPREKEPNERAVSSLCRQREPLSPPFFDHLSRASGIFADIRERATNLGTVHFSAVFPRRIGGFCTVPNNVCFSTTSLNGRFHGECSSDPRGELLAAGGRSARDGDLLKLAERYDALAKAASGD